MMLPSSFKAALHLNNLRIFLVKRRYYWSDFVFSSTLQLSPFVDLLLDKVGNEQTIEKIKLGLHEALVNAVVHGNSRDSSKSLRVRRIITPKWFVWQIQDAGKGIPEVDRKASLPMQIDASNGRGLFLIHHSFDDVRWSRKGNRLQVACRR